MEERFYTLRKELEMEVAGVIGKLSEGAVFLLFLPLPPTDPGPAGPLPHLSLLHAFRSGVPRRSKGGRARGG